MLKKIKIFSLAFLLLICTYSVYSAPYKIVSVDYKISGLTHPQALKENVPVSTTKEFETIEELEAYIEILKQDLINTRCFESSSITYEAGEDFIILNSEEIIPVNLLITAKDSLHFLGVPYIKYSSSNGLSLKLKAKDTNFLGTMNELNTSLDFQMKPDEDGTPFKIFEPAFNISIDYPFHNENYNLTWINDSSISYTWGESSPEFDFKTGLLFELPAEKTTFTWKFTQSIIRDFDYRTSKDDTYLKEYFAFYTPFILCETPMLNKVYATPTLSLTYNWDPFNSNGPSGIFDPRLQGPAANISGTFSMGKVNWNKNFRNGIYAEIIPAYEYNFGSILAENVKPHSLGFNSNLKYFKSLKHLGFYSQVNLFSYLENEKFYGIKNVDSYVRGVIDSRKNAFDAYQSETSTALVINCDLPVSLFTTDWENFPVTRNISFMRHLNFEVQVVPFFDSALIKTNRFNHGESSFFNPKNGFYGAGMEVLVFPLKWSSYVVRGSVGVDVGRKILGLDNDWRNTSCRSFEISIGLGTHY